jgi:hypothetical protein
MSLMSVSLVVQCMSLCQFCNLCAGQIRGVQACCCCKVNFSTTAKNSRTDLTLEATVGSLRLNGWRWSHGTACCSASGQLTALETVGAVIRQDSRLDTLHQLSQLQQLVSLRVLQSQEHPLADSACVTGDTVDMFGSQRQQGVVQGVGDIAAVTLRAGCLACSAFI